MADRYDFENLSPIEFETLCVDLVGAVTGLNFERFSEGPDGGADGRHSSSETNIILQAKHFKNSTWSDLKSAAKREKKNIKSLDPREYYFLTSQRLTPNRKKTLIDNLGHKSVKASNIWGRAEINDQLRNHDKVEKRHIKLWLSSTAVLQRMLNNDIAIFTEATHEEIERILKVYVPNPSLQEATEILKDRHCLIVSGPPGVGKTTLAQVLAAEYNDESWELVAMRSIDDGHAAFNADSKQVFVFDDFLGKIKLDSQLLAKDDNRIASFINMVGRRKNKRFILTTRSYVFEAARVKSEALDDEYIDLSELVLDLEVYNREIKARILYNHLYHSKINEEAINALLASGCIQKIVDHPNYMPRIIEWMTDEFRIRDVKPEQYPERFLETLKRPDKIWDKAFKNHISSEARILLLCMHFSETNFFPKSGVDLTNLKPFFEQAISKSGQIKSDSFNVNLFEETIRELKSSFIVVDDEMINFINPSLLDFLSNNVKNPRVLELLSSAAVSFDEAKSLWATVITQREEDPGLVIKVANNLQEAIQSGDVSGRMSFKELAYLIANLLLAVNNAKFLMFVRKGGLRDFYWIDHAELIPLIEELEEGRFRKLPHALACARMLRGELFTFITERYQPIEIDDVAKLATCFSDCYIEFPRRLLEEFIEAAQESIEALEPSLERPEYQESTLIDWMDKIEEIEMHFPEAIDIETKEEIEEILRGYEARAEEEMERYKNERSLARSSAGSDKAGGDNGEKSTNSHRELSDDELGAMFASLKKI